MESESLDSADSAGGDRTRRPMELRWLGSRELAWIREARRHFRAHPREYDERGFPIDQPPLRLSDEGSSGTS
jgi:hypothetical protein